LAKTPGNAVFHPGQRSGKILETFMRFQGLGAAFAGADEIKGQERCNEKDPPVVGYFEFHGTSMKLRRS
jgi:hypothetical protein